MKHTSHLSFWKFQQIHLLGLKCAPLLGSSFKVVEHPLVCIRVSWLEDLLLRISQRIVGFFSLIEKGFPRIFLVFLCMVFLLVILVIKTIVNGVASFVYGSST
jgi:hypothetical protein